MTLGTKGCVMLGCTVMAVCRVSARYNPWRSSDNTIEAIIAIVVLAGEAWLLFG